MRILVSLVSIIALSFSLTTACNKKKSSGGGSPAPEATPVPEQVAPGENISDAKARCDTLWTQRVAETPKNQVMSYRTTTTTQAPQGYPNASANTVVSSQDTITESTEAKITVQKVVSSTVNGYQSQQPETKTLTVTKATFVSRCEKNIALGAGELPESAALTWKAKPIETKTESITVNAGTYSATYNKALVTVSTSGSTASSEGTAEVWTIGAGYIAKTIKVIVISKSKYNTTQGETEVTTTMTRELVNYTKP